MKLKKYDFECCCCGEKAGKLARSLIKARLMLHFDGWASTSIDSKGAKDICGECFVKHKWYGYGKNMPFKQSIGAVVRQHKE